MRISFPKEQRKERKDERREGVKRESLLIQHVYFKRVKLNPPTSSSKVSMLSVLEPSPAKKT